MKKMCIRDRAEACGYKKYREKICLTEYLLFTRLLRATEANATENRSMKDAYTTLKGLALMAD